MKSKLPVLLPLFAIALALGIHAQDVPAPNPLKALLVAGGCCHDYKGQHQALFKGIQARANVQVDVFWTDDKSVNPPLPLYEKADWAKGYDVIIHDECAAGNKDKTVLKNILDAHKTIPAVHLHCAMHSFRVGNDDWFKHLGLKSTGHGPQAPIEIDFVDSEHPITAPLENWTTGNEELYNNLEIHDAHPLAMGHQLVKGKKVTQVVAWTNEKQGAPSFSTTIGHNTVTVEDDRYLNLVTRGLLWTCGKLNDEFLGKPFSGENKITFIPAAPSKPKPVPKIASAPKDATLVTVTASSEQNGNHTWQAVDGDKNTRWCAANSSKPQWIQLEFEKPTTITNAKILWEVRNGQWYQYKLETSKDGKAWDVFADRSQNTTPGDTEDKHTAEAVKFFRVTVLAQEKGLWSSLWEIDLSGPEIKKLWPRLDEKTAARLQNADKYAKSGNIPPKIVMLTAEEEAAIMKDVEVAEGFEATLFSSWQSANYPVYVAASPSGDLYVSSDGNGSLGRHPDRGRVLRLRDTDRDGRADQVTEFIKSIDAPRGLIWDHDRLYLLHPPHISVFYDRDGDGVAEDSKKLIDGIAFGFDKRPPDHTTNGLELGIDGWIYIAGGDFGFMEATGTDGRKLQHRSGGVLRFRPDGSNLEIFATGTRNILATPMSPRLDLFARDNTNDGGGWDVRFHHFTGLEDHGYPRLYKNFGDEIIQPLADYGGGSGCGGVYIDEPGFPAEWNDAPFTCDWGKAGLFKHTVEPSGATFVETKAPEKLIKVTRPTDADVDGMSAVYQASWKGPATFGWAGPDQGYIVRVTPKGYNPEPLPDFEKLSDADLVAQLESPSHIRRLTAQRAILRRPSTDENSALLAELMNDSEKPLESRIAALFTISQRGFEVGKRETIFQKFFIEDDQMTPFATRALGDLGEHKGSLEKLESEFLNWGLELNEPTRQLEAMVAAARLNRTEQGILIAPFVGSEDPIVAHTAIQSLVRLKAYYPAFAVLEFQKSGFDELQDPTAFASLRPKYAKKVHGAALALMRMHLREVVDIAIGKLGSEYHPEVRQALISILCRLYHKEAEWKGDSWGTRPDTRGPYYQLAKWEESEKILTTLKDLLANSEPSELAFLVKEMGRNRIQSDEALNKIIDLATKDESAIPDAISQLASSENVPATGVELAVKAANDPSASASTLAKSVQILAKSDHSEALSAILAALEALDNVKGFTHDHSAARDAFLKAPKLENHHLAVEKLAFQNPGSAQHRWANAALLALVDRKKGSPESREMSQKALDRAWQDAEHKVVLIYLVSAKVVKTQVLNGRILAALSDSDPKVAKAATETAKRLKLQLPGEDKTPKIATLKPEEAIQVISKFKGDIALGESVFQRATCAACHTVTQTEQQKGPYLGNIAQTYTRDQLVEAILEPNKTIAQGFATNVFTLKNGTVAMGFVTDEAGDSVTIRDIASNEHHFVKSEITKRDTLPTSMMPPGLLLNSSVREAASLVDYLQSLSKK